MPDRQQASAPAQIDQRDAARVYDRLASVYDAWAWLTESKARRRVIALADIRDGERVLEVAVGTGLAFGRIVECNPSGLNAGIDISPGMLAKTRHRLKDAGQASYGLARASALALPFADHSFDVLVNSYMLDLIATSDWPRILGEYRRVLGPKGRLVIASMTHGRHFGAGIYERVFRRFPALGGGCRAITVEEPLEDCGFDVLHREYVQQALFPSEVVLAAPREP